MTDVALTTARTDPTSGSASAPLCSTACGEVCSAVGLQPLHSHPCNANKVSGCMFHPPVCSLVLHSTAILARMHHTAG